ncbi:MAG: VanZ family protein [Maribacter sp.]|nr:VanZ family protein [Maribacter sp.]
MLKRHGFLIIFISWMVFVTWLSLASFSNTHLPGYNIPNFDKLVHFTFYFVAVVLGVLAMRKEISQFWSFEKAAVFLLVAMVLFGIIIEFVQFNFTTDRMGDPYDALANSVGALCGSLVMKFVVQKTKGLKWKQ